ncbi:hypothetical protein KCP73_12400 [Salmonella enterica subsp. enterica]|nr:hypothetical protein KCP73_12400 [Salmonella enterica subsp. enterica]
MTRRRRRCESPASASLRWLAKTSRHIGASAARSSPLISAAAIPLHLAATSGQRTRHHPALKRKPLRKLPSNA